MVSYLSDSFLGAFREVLGIKSFEVGFNEERRKGSHHEDWSGRFFRAWLLLAWECGVYAITQSFTKLWAWLSCSPRTLACELYCQVIGV